MLRPSARPVAATRAVISKRRVESRRIPPQIRPVAGRRLRFAADLYGAFPVKGFSLAVGRLIADCRLGFADSSLFGAEEAVLRPVACDQVPGARGRGQGTKR